MTEGEGGSILGQICMTSLIMVPLLIPQNEQMFQAGLVVTYMLAESLVHARMFGIDVAHVSNRLSLSMKNFQGKRTFQIIQDGAEISRMKFIDAQD